MSARRMTFAAGLVGGLAWLVKVALIWGNGGTNTDQGLVAASFLIGLAALVAAAAATGIWLTANRPVLLRVLAGILGVVLMFVLFSLLDAGLSPLASDGHWFQDEIEILAAALIGLALAWAARPGATMAGTASSPSVSHE